MEEKTLAGIREDNRFSGEACLEERVIFISRELGLLENFGNVVLQGG